MKNKLRFAVVWLLLVALTGMAVVPSMAQDTTITFLTPPWGVPPDEDALNAFMEETGITVEIQSVQTQDLFSRVQVSAATGEPAADVIFLTEEAPSNIVATGNMMALNDMIDNLDADDFEKIDFWTVDDQVYGVTTYLQLVMMDYNAATLAEAGFDAAPTTWAELEEMSLAVREAGIDDNPIAMGAIDWSWYLIALSMGDPMFDEDLNPVFADEGSKARDAMALLLSWFEQELISPEILAGSSTQHTLFWSGTGVFHQGWQGSVRVGNNPDTSQQAPNVEYFLLPEESFTWSFPAAIGITEGSENVEASWQFIEWYVGEQNQRDIYNAFGLVPSRVSVQEALADEGLIDGFDIISEQSMFVNELPRYTLWWGPFTDVVSESILEAAQTGTDADTVIDNLAGEWNELREEFE
jgi:ABC-type glycerol-3-phosphate transport system substrate-binding protein